MEFFGLVEGKPVLFVTGGSLGARGINKGIEAALPLLKEIPLPSGARWSMTVGDLVMLVTLLLLFVELLKSTYTSTASLLDHGLSMLIFVACLVEFIVVRKAATSVFFFITIATLIDVIAGYTIGIRVARRDLSIGGSS